MISPSAGNRLEEDAVEDGALWDCSVGFETHPDRKNHARTVMCASRGLQNGMRVRTLSPGMASLKSGIFLYAVLDVHSAVQRYLPASVVETELKPSGLACLPNTCNTAARPANAIEFGDVDEFTSPLSTLFQMSAAPCGVERQLILAYPPVAESGFP